MNAKRKGPGRKSLFGAKDRVVSVTLTDDAADRLWRLALEARVTRSDFIEAAIRFQGKETVEAIQRLRERG